MKSRLNPNSVMFTDGVHQGGVSFDGTNFKAEDGAGNLIRLAVKEPKTADEAVPLKLLNGVRAFTVPTFKIAAGATFDAGVLDLGTLFAASWPDEYAIIQSHLAPTEQIMCILLNMVIYYTDRKSTTHVGETVSFTCKYSGTNFMILNNFPSVPLDDYDAVGNWSILVHKGFDNPITSLSVYSPNATGWVPMTDYYIVLLTMHVNPVVITCNTTTQHYGS